jgi:8-oxo-dGTP pyrophosphatase MutT (NUDIX family)
VITDGGHGGTPAELFPSTADPQAELALFLGSQAKRDHRACRVQGMRAEVRDRLSVFPRIAVELGGHRPAAVAIALCTTPDGDPSFLLTKRAPKLRAHAGQWALPGGRVDPGETVEDAARRELHEELGLDVPATEVLGLLDDYQTRSGFVITPVVVWAGHDPRVVPNPAEVAASFIIPLTELDRPDAPRFVTIPESDRPVVQMPLLDHVIHAPTAAVLYQLREVVLHGRATRVSHLEQPVFAWR